MEPLAYFITFTTYGTWLHGRDPGSVDREHNVPGTPRLDPDAALFDARMRAMKQPPYELDAPRRTVVLDTILEVCRHRTWSVHAVHVRTTHVHVVLTGRSNPEKVMSDLKAWSSRRLREVFAEGHDRDRWTQHGSTRYLNDVNSVVRAVAYVLDEQGTPMARYPNRTNDDNNEPDA